MHKNTKNVLTKALALTLAVSMMTVSAPAARHLVRLRVLVLL